MAIRFQEDLSTLLRDLEKRGYRIKIAKRLEGTLGRGADVFLENGVVVRWEGATKRVWAEGPLTQVWRVEATLKRLYEPGRLARLFFGPRRIASAPVAGESAPVADHTPARKLARLTAATTG